MEPFAQNGLDIDDYIVETTVTTVQFSDLMKQVLVPVDGESQAEGAFLVLIDTEGFDCNIVEGISTKSQFLPKYLVFEHKHCDWGPTTKHLHSMGYTTTMLGANIFAIHTPEID